MRVNAVSYSSSSNLITKVPHFVQCGGPQRTLPAGLYAPRLGRLSNLTRLNLSNSCLYGDIPPELRRLTNLTVLDLRSNPGLKGCMPKSLRNLSSLGQTTIDALPTDLGLEWRKQFATGACAKQPSPITNWEKITQC